MPQLTTCLWFDGRAEEAAEFYTSVFSDAHITEVSRFPEGAPEPAGTVMTANFEISGQKFFCLNGGPHFAFSEAISFQIPCKDQQEVDYYWEKLTADGGEEGQCAWLKDKFGVSWQVIPDRLGELLSNPDPEKAQRTMTAMLAMKKIVIAELEAAAQ
ncbi:MAG: VOC family protein [Mycobacteriaceae bacterium]